MLVQAFSLSQQRHHGAEIEFHFGTRLIFRVSFILTRILGHLVHVLRTGTCTEMFYFYHKTPICYLIQYK